jgi:peptidoglycan DL-endopeptidase CwlO
VGACEVSVTCARRPSMRKLPKMRSFLLIPILCAAACAAPGMAARPDAAASREQLAEPDIAVQSATFAPRADEQVEQPRPTPTAGDRIARRAGDLVGRDSVAQIAPGYTDDCSGFVRLVYATEGVDLSRLPARSSIVSAMYVRARENGALREGSPAPGDLVFFRNTYDRNRDGRRNDGLTHVGIVEVVHPDGTVIFVHRGSRGIVRARLNLERPTTARESGEKLNDVLRRKSKHARAYLAGELFAGYASPEGLGRAAVAQARRPPPRRRARYRPLPRLTSGGPGWRRASGAGPSIGRVAWLF